MNEPSPREWQLACPVPLDDHATVQLAHGGGGRLMRNLIEGLFLSAFAPASPLPLAGEGQGVRAAPVASGQWPVVSGQGEAASGNPPPLAPRPQSPVANPQSPIPNPSSPPHDAAVLPVGGSRLAFTTDSFVVSPLFFPGGDIGKLAVCGTINDLAMAGAKPAYLSAGFILEEGLSFETLRRVVASMAETARAAGVRIVTGDTKVVDRGKADGIFINTAGIGWVRPGVEISPARVRPGDAILLSGDLGRHGMAIMSVREGLRFEGALESDCAPLTGLVETMLDAEPDIHCLRDLTRGGLAAAINEIALDAGVGIEIEESGDSGGRTGGRGVRAARARPTLRGQRGPACGDRARGVRRSSARSDAFAPSWSGLSSRRRGHGGPCRPGRTSRPLWRPADHRSAVG